MKPKCPNQNCDSTDFIVRSMGFPPMPLEPGKERRFMPKNFICCEKCGTIIGEYDESAGEILKMLDAINDNIYQIVNNTIPRRSVP
jgi:hypothetical protein